SWWKSRYTHKLFSKLMLIAAFSAVYVAVMAYGIAVMKGFQMNGPQLLFKVLEITLITTASIIGFIFVISVSSCKWLLSRGEEPDNWLIPLTTSVADFGSLLLFSYLVATLA
ncbi:MAG: hypothetical protein QXD77_01805, partial [Candidatus Aenigmatarchaeota archaeon]